jgi:hypothetical protein
MKYTYAMGSVQVSMGAAGITVTVDKLMSRFPKTMGRDNIACVSLPNMRTLGAACGDLALLRPAATSRQVANSPMPILVRVWPLDKIDDASTR